MNEFTAYYFDGESSQRREVRIHFIDPDKLRILDLDQELTFNLSELRITPRLANTPRFIYLPGGAKCETTDNDTVDAILRHGGRGRWTAFLHTLETKKRYVLLCVILTVIGIWGLIDYGLPTLAKWGAYSLPAYINVELGRDGLRLLDQIHFVSSGIDGERQSQLRALFQDITLEMPKAYDYQLEFRRSEKIGPNAFALPSGIIVITDELVEIAEHENELVAIFAHEIGHVIHRHALRSLLQNSATILLIASITGDLTSITALSSALPTMLIESKYSRAFERDADGFALEYLQKHNLSPTHFVDILLRMEEKHDQEIELPNYLSSHPATQQRVKMLIDEE